MRPGEFNFEIWQGSTWDYMGFNIFDPEGELIDISDKTIKMQLRKYPSATEVIAEFSTDNGFIVVDSGNWKGDWSETTEYELDDVVEYEITQGEVTEKLCFKCIDPNQDEPPSLNSDYWSVFYNVKFNVSAEETALIPAGDFVYDLEIRDEDLDPYIETKAFAGKFIIKPEITR